MATLIKDKYEALGVGLGGNEPPHSLSLIVGLSKSEHAEID